jgi:hypothetical protein
VTTTASWGSLGQGRDKPAAGGDKRRVGVDRRWSAGALSYPVRQFLAAVAALIDTTTGDRPS